MSFRAKPPVESFIGFLVFIKNLVKFPVLRGMTYFFARRLFVPPYTTIAKTAVPRKLQTPEYLKKTANRVPFIKLHPRLRAVFVMLNLVQHPPQISN